MRMLGRHLSGSEICAKEENNFLDSLRRVLLFIMYVKRDLNRQLAVLADGIHNLICYDNFVYVQRA